MQKETRIFELIPFYQPDHSMHDFAGCTMNKLVRKIVVTSSVMLPQHLVS